MTKWVVFVFVSFIGGVAVGVAGSSPKPRQEIYADNDLKLIEALVARGIADNEAQATIEKLLPGQSVNGITPAALRAAIYTAINAKRAP